MNDRDNESECLDRPEDVDIPIITVNDEQGQGGVPLEAENRTDKKKEELKALREEKLEDFLR